MFPLRPFACLALMLLPVSCGLSLNYPVEAETGATPASASAGGANTRVADDAGSTAFGLPEEAASSADAALSWNELTGLAREDRQAGRLDEARTRLEQAAIQLAERPPSDAGRRAVFDLQARLALDFIAIGRPEDADAMAEPLFTQAEQEPELASSALVDLAYSTASRRAESSETAAPPLGLLQLALGAAEQGPASPQRMQMAADIALQALEQGDLVLARRGIDRAVLDARTIAPTNRTQLASIKIYKSRIARAQGDLETAEASAVSAAQLFEQGRSGPANLTVADATLAEALADQGEIERAREKSDEALRRANGDPPLPDFVKRIALGAHARVDRAAGDLEAARARYEQALAIPAGGFTQDAILIADLEAELGALDTEVDEASAGMERLEPPSVESRAPEAPSADPETGGAGSTTTREAAP